MVMVLVLFANLKINALAVDYFSVVMPKVQAEYRKIGVILLNIVGYSRPFYD
jgi:hypothetical protein